MDQQLRSSIQTSATDRLIIIQRLGLNDQVEQQQQHFHHRKIFPNPRAISNFLSHICGNSYEQQQPKSGGGDIITTTTTTSRLLLGESSSSPSLMVNSVDFLNYVPNEVICLIALFLDDQSLSSLLRTSKQFNTIVDDEHQFWGMKCQQYLDRDNLNHYLKDVGSYKKVYSELFSKKPFYHHLTSSNVLIFHETYDSGLFSLFDVGIVLVDPRECSELAQLVNEPFEQMRSINNCKINLLQMFTMGIREVLFVVDVTECNNNNGDHDDSENQFKSTLLPIISTISKKVGFRNIELLFVCNYKTRRGIDELFSTIEKVRMPSYQKERELRGFIIDIEHQHRNGKKLEIVAKVGTTSGTFVGQPFSLVVDKKDILVDSYTATRLYNDQVVKRVESKLLRLQFSCNYSSNSEETSGGPLKNTAFETINLIGGCLPKKTKSFTCQIIMLTFGASQGDLLLCIGCYFKILVKVRSLISTIDKRTGRVTMENPELIKVGEAGSIECELIDGSHAMIAPFVDSPMSGRLLFHKIPNTMVDSFLSNNNNKRRESIQILEQYQPGAVSVCKSISTE